MSNKRPPVKRKSRNPVIQFNKLAMFFGNPYTIDLEGRRGSVTLKTPTMEPIIALGYEGFFSSLKPLITNTTEYRLPLHKAGIDWCELSDFELFCMLKQNISPYVSSLLFEDIPDFEAFKLTKRTDPDGKESLVLYDDVKEVEIDEEVYFHISQFFREAFKAKPEEDITKDPELKELKIQKDENHLLALEARNQQEILNGENQLLACISSLVNHPGFKYKHDEIKNLNVCQFYDSISRIQIFESSTALMKGMYSGFVDGSKIKSEDYNFMRAI